MRDLRERHRHCVPGGRRHPRRYGDVGGPGKTAGKDLDADKTTYPKLMGLDGARAEAERLYQEAIDSVVPYGEAAIPLIAIAKYIVERKSLQLLSLSLSPISPNLVNSPHVLGGVGVGVGAAIPGVGVRDPRPRANARI